MKYIKCFWGIRAIFYKFFFKEFKFHSYIGKPCFILGSRKVSIKKKVRIFPGLRIECHRNGEILIEENVSIGQNFHITSAGTLKIGKNTTISGNVLVTNIDHEYREMGIHILEQDLLIKETKIGENSFIGFGAIIQAGTILGKQCIVGSNSVVRGIYPDYSVIVGNPGKIVKKYNTETNEWERT